MISKNYKRLRWYQNPSEDLLGFSAPHVPIFFEAPSWPHVVFSLRFEILFFWAWRPGGSLKRLWVHVGHLVQRGPPLGSGTNGMLLYPWISSAMAMAMSIYRTLCVLVQLLSLFFLRTPCIGECKFIFILNFSAVCFQVSSKIVFPRRGKITLVAFEDFLS